MTVQGDFLLCSAGKFNYRALIGIKRKKMNKIYKETAVYFRKQKNVTYFYHFVTDEGITLVFHQEPGKPFVAMLIGFLAVLFLFGSTFTALFATIVYKNNDNNKTEK